MKLTYHISPTSLGPMLVVLNGNEVCFSHFGDSESHLLSLLREVFTQDAPVPSREDPTFDASAIDRCMARYVQGQLPSRSPTFAPYQPGTPFQLKVWAYVRSIPSGEVRSYQQVARAIGHPSATRAVASACARNDIALIIPCHRVVRSDGSLGGYRWGINRKRALLESERRARV